MKTRNIVIIPIVLLLVVLTLYAAPNASKPEVPAAEPAAITIPFDLKGGLVFIKVKVNGKAADFILDSGAPMMVLSSRLEANATDTLEGQGVSGAIKLQRTVVNDFELGGVRQQEVPAITLDLAHLEAITKRPIDGLIGYSTLKDYELLIDYKDKNITLFKPNTTAFHQQIKPTSEMPFELQAHIPVVEATIGDQTMRFGLDTGAEANLIDLVSQARLSSADYKKGKTSPMSGANLGQTSVQEAYVGSTLINGHSYQDMHYVFSDISHFNQGYGLNIDGLLGYPFLSARKLSVNFQNRTIYFWE